MLEYSFSRFLVASFAASVILLLVLPTKKLLHKHISTKGHYNLWLFALPILAIPLVPFHSKLSGFTNLFSFASFGRTATEAIAANTAGNNMINGTNWLNDFTISVNRSTPETLMFALAVIWLVGVIVSVIIAFVCSNKIREMKKTIKPLNAGAAHSIFTESLSALKITKPVILGESTLIKAPMTIGIFKTYVILPAKIAECITQTEQKHIILHELIHIRKNDVLINYVLCLFQIVYWFNPLVFLAFKHIRTDREIACDISVLNMLNENDFIDYGRTIISFADKISKPERFAVAADMSGTKKQIKARIEKIASYSAESRRLRIKSTFVCLLISCIVFSQIPVISAMAYDDRQYNFTARNVSYEDLSSFFNGISGSFVLYDMQADQYSIYNKEKSIERVSPDSTYKIYSTLIALEQQTIRANSSAMSWDGTKYPYEAWNRVQDLSSAMQSSVSWYFQVLDKKSGLGVLQGYFDKLSYGNRNLSGGVADYWMESSLKISPVEQVQLLERFYEGNMPFGADNVNTVKEIIKLSEKDDAILSGKTGSGTVNGKGINGWFVGYVEKSGNTYFFAINIQDKDNINGSAAAKIALSILGSKGIY